jgi:voltage-gated potassium channel
MPSPSGFDRVMHSAHEHSAKARHLQLTAFARRIVLVALLAVGLLVFGTVGLEWSEHVGLWYAFRWSLNTAATAGNFPEPHSTSGQAIELALTVLGVGTLFYALATVTEFLVAGHLGDLLGVRRMEKMIGSLEDHHIICGFGRVGRQVARDLRAARVNYVVVDSNHDNRTYAEAQDAIFIGGDATEDTVLLEAGITRARSLIACADSDADNVFITLTARELRSDIPIVARAAIEDTEKKLRRAGANRVISPYKSSGTEMARLALHPHTTGVVDVDAEYHMQEIVVGDAHVTDAPTLGKVRGNNTIVGLRRGSEFQPQPPEDTTLLPGDIVVAMGHPHALAQLAGEIGTPPV